MKTLVAYFSHAGQNYVNGGVAELEHGNAEVLAGFAAQACGGD
ncbi:MAG: flavodoxin, partial [Coriobacteriaceae bacterium]|nr:flavodoxin [Coriobacteriaceae bacterium]